MEWIYLAQYGSQWFERGNNRNVIHNPGIIRIYTIVIQTNANKYFQISSYT